MKPSTVSTSGQTNQTDPSFNAHSLKAAICKTLALKIGNEINNDTIAPSTRRAFFKILYNIFLLSSKKIPFEQYIAFLFGDLASQFVKQTPATSLSSTALLLNKIFSISSMPYKKFWMLSILFSTISGSPKS